MDKKTLQKPFLLIFLFFVVVNAAAFVFASQLDAADIGHLTLIGANTLLFLLVTVTLLMSIKAMRNSNPNVFVRSVMGGTFIKLMAVIVAVAVYMVLAGKNKSIGAVLCGMGLYIVYTFFEVRSALRLNSVKNGRN